MDHDYGLAPNPFWGFMTLAVCKGHIRSNKNLKLEDWIIATGSKKLGFEKNLIYAMKVEQIITFDEYWSNSKYGCKKPILNGTLAQMYGDNFYHTEADGRIIQEPSAHSNPDLSINTKHTKADSDGKYVLISKDFYYFGDTAPVIPQDFQNVISNTRDYIYLKIPNEIRLQFVDWLRTNFSIGVHGDPISWKNFNLEDLTIYKGED